MVISIRGRGSLALAVDDEGEVLDPIRSGARTARLTMGLESAAERQPIRPAAILPGSAPAIGLAARSGLARRPHFKELRACSWPPWGGGIRHRMTPVARYIHRN